MIGRTLAGGAALAAAWLAQDETVTVTIADIEPSDGTIYVVLQTEDQFLSKDGAYEATTSASVGVAEVAFEDVEPGRYAVAVVHDVDGDGETAFGQFGPEEPWGLSNGVHRGLPSFDDAAIEVGRGDTTATVTLIER